MAIRAVVFDIGGVLEITPDLGMGHLWERRLGLPAGEVGRRLQDVWLAGSLGTVTEADVHLGVMAAHGFLVGAASRAAAMIS